MSYVGIRFHVTNKHNKRGLHAIRANSKQVELGAGRAFSVTGNGSELARSHVVHCVAPPLGRVIRHAPWREHSTKGPKPMDLKLTKKIALVTGSTAGIGNAIAAS